jgi:hypothetical protein
LPAPFEHHPAAYAIALRNLGHAGSRLAAFFNDPGFFGWQTAAFSDASLDAVEWRHLNRPIEQMMSARSLRWWRFA